MALSSAFTMANTMMGCALLSFSYAYSRLGWVIATILLGLICWFEVVTYKALVNVAHYGQFRTLHGMLEEIFGRKFAYFIDGTIALTYLGYLTVYTSIYADYMQMFIQNVSGGKKFKTEYLKLIIMPILLLQCCMKSPDAIAKVSAFAIFMIVATVLAITVYFIIYAARNETEIYFSDKDITKKIPFPKPMDTIWPANPHPGYAVLEVIQRFTLFMPLYGAQSSVSSIYYDLKAPPNFKHKAMLSGVTIAVISSTIMYFMAGFFGLLMFGRDVAGNILLSFSPNNIVITIVRLLYTLVVVLSYVVVVYPTRNIIMDWFNLTLDTKKGLTAFYVIAVVFVIITTALSIAVPDIVKVIGFIASIFGIPLFNCIPILAVYITPKLRAESKVPETDDEE